MSDKGDLSLTHAKHWVNFSKTADFTEELIGKIDPATDPTSPYVLVYSHSQEDFSRIGELPEQVKTEFNSATYADMYVYVETLLKDRKDLDRIDPRFFMFSTRSRKKIAR